MNRRTLIFLGVVCVVLLLLAVVAPQWSSQGGGGSSTPASRSLDLHRFTQQETTAVTIRRAGQKTVSLTKVNGSWLVGGKQADAGKITALFQSFAQLKVGALASRNPANAARFGADEKTGTTLVLTVGSTSTTFIVGNAADGSAAFYMKRSGDRDVYEVTGTLQTEVTQQASAWLPSKAAPTKPVQPPGTPSAPGTSSVHQ